MTGLLTDEERERISQAITHAERQTSGEIVAVLARESASYLHAPFLWAAIIALLVPWPLIYFTWWPVAWIYILQLAVFAVILALTLPRPVRYWLVPSAVKQQRAYRRAVEQFLVQSLHTTQSRTGVLIYVSIAERYAVILSDTAIDARVERETWQRIVDDLTSSLSQDRACEGFLKAIQRCGELLGTHFPPGARDPNVLPDHLIILD